MQQVSPTSLPIPERTVQPYTLPSVSLEAYDLTMWSKVVRLRSFFSYSLYIPPLKKHVTIQITFYSVEVEHFL